MLTTFVPGEELGSVIDRVPLSDDADIPPRNMNVTYEPPAAPPIDLVATNCPIPPGHGWF